MVNIRPLQENDLAILQESLYNSKVHAGVTVQDFFKEGTVSSAYEDENGLVAVARLSPLREKDLLLDTHFIDDGDKERNGKVILVGLGAMIESARDLGFKAIEFETQSERLKKFCTRRLSFIDVGNSMLRKDL